MSIAVVDVLAALHFRSGHAIGAAAHLLESNVSPAFFLRCGGVQESSQSQLTVVHAITACRGLDCIAVLEGHDELMIL